MIKRIVKAVLRRVKHKYYRFINFYITKALPLTSDGSIEFKGNFGSRGHISFQVLEGGELSIGDNVFVNKNSSFTVRSKIAIGNNVLIGENVRFFDHNHRFRDEDELILNQGYSISDIVVEDNVWIGSNVVILKGVTIGTGSVIRAGCIIYKDIPKNTLVKNQQNLQMLEII